MAGLVSPRGDQYGNSNYPSALSIRPGMSMQEIGMIKRNRLHFDMQRQA